MIILNMLRGFFMALADSVPGVSGGTIAFIMGFYEEFISALNTLVSKSKSIIEKKQALIFLGKIGSGWIVGLTLSVFILASIFESEIYKISSVFIGLILFSIPLIVKEEAATLKKNLHHLIFTIVGLVFVYWMTVLGGELIQSTGQAEDFSFLFGLYIFLAGMVAISAMILPGISGSSFLLIFGVYSTIIISVKETLSFNFNYIPILIFFGLGIVTGVLSIIRLLKYLLSNHRSKMIYLILGLMIGSLYAVIMGPTTLDVPKSAMRFETFNIFFFLLGGIIIFGLDEIKKHLN